MKDVLGEVNKNTVSIPESSIFISAIDFSYSKSERLLNPRNIN
tara:strand:- start:38 stop:166 length:129 start_codon:yes stop_codon:yes gene_type:complete